MSETEREDAILKTVMKHLVFNENGLHQILISDLRKELETLYCPDNRVTESELLELFAVPFPVEERWEQIYDFSARSVFKVAREQGWIKR